MTYREMILTGGYAVLLHLCGLGGVDMLLLHSRAISSKHLIPTFSLWQISTTFWALLIQWGTYIFIARALGPQRAGIYLFVQWLAAVTIPLIGIGTSTLASRRIAEVQSRETLRSSAGVFYFLWYRQCYRILLYCLLYIILAYPLHALFAICQPRLLLLACLSMLPLLLSSIVGITLRSLRRSDLLTILHFCGAISALLLSLLACRISKDHISLLLLASTLAGTLPLLLALLYLTHLLPLRHALQPGIFLKERLQQHFKGTPLLFFCDVIIWQHSEILVLACWRSSDELAFYTISSLACTGIMQLLPLLFSRFLSPLLYHYFSQKYKLTSHNSFVLSSCSIGLLALVFGVLFFICSPWLLILLLGRGYLPLLQPLHILLISSFFGSIASISLTYLLDDKHKRFQLYIGVVAALVNVLLALPFIAWWGMLGAALACASAQLISAISTILICSRLLKQVATPSMEQVI
jgi:O-antigen/teichoic acid export membrane protein